MSERKYLCPLLMDVSALRVVECVFVSQCFPFRSALILLYSNWCVCVYVSACVCVSGCVSVHVKKRLQNFIIPPCMLFTSVTSPLSHHFFYLSVIFFLSSISPLSIPSSPSIIYPPVSFLFLSFLGFIARFVCGILSQKNNSTS